MHPLSNASQVLVRPPRKPQSGTPGYFSESADDGTISYPGQDWFNDCIDEFLNLLASYNVDYDAERVDHLVEVFNRVNSNIDFIGVVFPVPWFHDVIPDGYVVMNNQEFDAELYPKTAQAFPSGRLLDPSGRAFVGVATGEIVGNEYDGDVIQHSHDAQINSLNAVFSGNELSEHYHMLATNTSSAGDSASPSVQNYLGKAIGSINNSQRYLQSVNTPEPTIYRSAYQSAGTPTGTVEVSDADITIGNTGGNRNTIDRIACRFIVRLA